VLIPYRCNRRFNKPMPVGSGLKSSFFHPF
jgi:hypothetical protein